MNVLSKMMTALKGTINEVGEAIVDSQAIRILDQEIRDASEDIKFSQKKLNQLIAKQKLAEEKASQLKVMINEHEDYAKKALKKKDKNLAHDLAVKIAEAENQLEIESESAKRYKQQVQDLEESIQQAERDVQRMKQQVDTVKATESMQKAQAAVSVRQGGNKARLQTAMDSLERIKERQALKAKNINSDKDVLGKVTDPDLEKRLEAAGIKPKSNSAEAVLERLKKK